MLFDCERCNAKCCKAPFISAGQDTRPWMPAREWRARPALNEYVASTPDGGVLLSIEGPDGPQCKALNGPRCSVYEDRPDDCRVYPLFPYGDQVVIHAMCPDALSFCYRLAKGDPEAVDFFDRTAKMFRSMAPTLRRRLEGIASAWKFHIVVGAIAGRPTIDREGVFRLYREKAVQVQNAQAEPHEALLWGTRENHIARFKTILDLAAPHVSNCRTMIDVGCGYGDLSGWFPMLEYTGIDPVEAFVAGARSRYPMARPGFFCTDLESFDRSELKHRNYDLSVACGCEIGTSPAQVSAFVAQMWGITNRVAIFNGLSTSAYAGNFEAVRPSLALEVALRYTSDVTLVHSIETQSWAIRMVRRR